MTQQEIVDMLNELDDDYDSKLDDKDVHRDIIDEDSYYDSSIDRNVIDDVADNYVNYRNAIDDDISDDYVTNDYANDKDVMYDEATYSDAIGEYAIDKDAIYDKAIDDDVIDDVIDDDGFKYNFIDGAGIGDDVASHNSVDDDAPYDDFIDGAPYDDFIDGASINGAAMNGYVRDGNNKAMVEVNSQSKQICQNMKEKGKEIERIVQQLSEAKIKQRKKYLRDRVNGKYKIPVKKPLQTANEEYEYELPVIKHLHGKMEKNKVPDMKHFERMNEEYELPEMKVIGEDNYNSKEFDDFEDSYPVSDHMSKNGEKNAMKFAPQKVDDHSEVITTVVSGDNIYSTYIKDEVDDGCCPTVPSRIKVAEDNMERCERCEDLGEEAVCGANGQTYRTLCHAVNCAGLELRHITHGACNTKVSHCSYVVQTT